MANIKFSQFTAEADIANFDDIVGYAGAVNTRITPANLASSLITLSGGPYLPLTAGPTVPLTGDLNLAATGAGPSVGSQAVVFNGVDDTTTAVISAKIFTLDSTANPAGQDLIFQNANDAGAIQTNFYISAFGQVGIGGFTPASPPQFNLDVSGDSNFGGAAGFSDTVTFDDAIIDTTGTAGQIGKVLVAQSGGIEWVDGYNAVQSFVWTNAPSPTSPAPYTNWPSATASFLPFDTTPIIESTNLPTGTTVSNYVWTCTNSPGGNAGQVATFTLGANGEGTWKIRTCQHWFDQTSQVEMRVSLEGTATGGAKIDVIDQKSTELTGDKIFYGELIQVCGGGDTIQVECEFTVGGVNPFPSDQGNRPIEVTFEKIV